MIAADAQRVPSELEAHLRPFVARRVSAPADVDDVVQDVFLRMQRGLSTLRSDERFGPWLYQIARSAIADHHRARARHPLASPGAESALEAADPSADAGVTSAHEGELASCVTGLVAKLASPYREALTLTELEGVTQKQAAEMVGISLSGMKSRVQRGREQLRAVIETCCKIDLDRRGQVIACDIRTGGTVGPQPMPEPIKVVESTSPT